MTNIALIQGTKIENTTVEGLSAAIKGFSSDTAVTLVIRKEDISALVAKTSMMSPTECVGKISHGATVVTI